MSAITSNQLSHPVIPQNIQHFPPEILREVFKFLGALDSMSFSRVCKNFKIACQPLFKNNIQNAYLEKLQQVFFNQLVEINTERAVADVGGLENMIDTYQEQIIKQSKIEALQDLDTYVEKNTQELVLSKNQALIDGSLNAMSDLVGKSKKIASKLKKAVLEKFNKKADIAFAEKTQSILEGFPKSDPKIKDKNYIALMQIGQLDYLRKNNALIENGKLGFLAKK